MAKNSYYKLYSGKPDYSVPIEYTCLNNVIPKEEQALFFTNMDGTIDWGKYTWDYFQIQFYLIPRVITALHEGSGRFEGYSWFIGKYMDKTQFNTISLSNNIKFVMQCGSFTVLHN